jgi:predicted ATP-grasp superfamily ATP-dependent carboligase
VKVLVTDGNNRVALAIVRALGRAGAEVTVVEQERFATRRPAAFLSRHVRRHAVIPSLEDRGAFLEALAREARGADVLLPVSTNVVLACAEHRDRLPARVPVPPAAVVRRANDKSAVLAVARKAGVPIPVSYAPESDEELEEVVARVRLPAIVKLRDDEGTTLDPGDRYARVDSADGLRQAYRSLHRLRPFPVIQERIAGGGFGVGVLAKEGRLLAAFCHRRVREYPVTGGPSAVCESLRDPRLVDYAARVIAELRWTGVAMVEFKKDDDYRLLEVNPRFWGSLPLATAAGVNFPELLCRMALGDGPAAPPSYREGVRLRFLPMDMAAAWSALRRPGAPPGYVTGFLRDLFDPAVRDGILELGDWRASVAYWMNRLR